MNLTRPKPQRPLISLVSMIDVLLIMLVFFMVTSTYLNLDMIPVAQSGEPENAALAATNDGRAAASSTLLLSLSAGGTVTLSGQRYGFAELQSALSQRLAQNAEVRVLILPSGHAKTQTLISAMDAVTKAGITNLRIVELEARP